MSKFKLKEEAIRLRKLGYSYSYIVSRVPVSKGTLTPWLSGIPYTPNEFTKKNATKGLLAAIEVKRKQKELSFSNARLYAEKDVGSLTKRDVFMLGLGVYVGEGSKTHNIIRVVNSDPKIISFAIRWFQSVAGIKNSNFVIRLHLYPDNNVTEAIHFWSLKTGIPHSQFQKISVDSRKNKVAKTGKLPYGTAHLSVVSRGNKEFGVLLSRRIGAWIEKALE